MIGQLKPVVWLGSSRADLRAFPDTARRDAGEQLRAVQRGEMPRDWRPLTSVGPGVVEIRIHAAGGFRVMYIATFAEAVHVLHAFQKKTQRTRERDIALARRRLADLRRDRGR